MALCTEMRPSFRLDDRLAKPLGNHSTSDTLVPRRSLEPKKSGNIEPFHWLKYGEKLLRDRRTVRTYYRCSAKGETGCEAKKMVDMVGEAPGATATHYRDEHNHPCGPPPPQQTPLQPVRGGSPGSAVPDGHAHPSLLAALALQDLRPLSGPGSAGAAPASAGPGPLTPERAQLRMPGADGEDDWAPTNVGLVRPPGPSVAGSAPVDRSCPGGSTSAEMLLLEHLLQLHFSGGTGSAAAAVTALNAQGLATPFSSNRDSCRPQPPAGPSLVSSEVLGGNLLHERPGELQADNNMAKRTRHEESVAVASNKEMDPLAPVNDDVEQTAFPFVRQASWGGPQAEASRWSSRLRDAASNEGGCTEAPFLKEMQCTHQGCTWLALGKAVHVCRCYSG